jgi:uncharacterized protein (DUF1499 family)
LIVIAVVLLVILVTGPLGYKYSLVPLEPSLISLLVAVIGSAIVILVSLVYTIIAVRAGLSRNRNMLMIAMLLSLIPIATMAPQMSKAGSVPPIHDITTDTANPPEFVAAKALRANAPNGSEYGASEAWPAEKLALATQEAYPELESINSTLSFGDAVDRAELTLKEMGLEIIAVDKAAGIVEATATTRWFGFKDDMVIRIVSVESGSTIDLRSMSRVGQGDVGANAARISEFVAQF